MRITLLCNCGLAVECSGAVLLVDVPNGSAPPFYRLPADAWQRIVERQPPYDRLAGIYITHQHSDHCDLDALRAFQRRWPDVPCLLPSEETPRGSVGLGPFTVEYEAFPHAPIPNPPPHRVTWIRAGERCVYLAADAALEPEAHRAFLRGRKADAAFFNAMYLSRPETRRLLREAAAQCYIYHMPREGEGQEIWAKCRRNLERYPEELAQVSVLGNYPTVLEFPEANLL